MADPEDMSQETCPGGQGRTQQAALGAVDRRADQAGEHQPGQRSRAAETDRQQRRDDARERGAHDLRKAGLREVSPREAGVVGGRRGQSGARAREQGDQRREHARGEDDEHEGAGEQVVGAAEGRATGGRKCECEHVSPGSAEVHRNRTCPGSSSHPAPVLKTGGRTSAPSTSAAEHSGSRSAREEYQVPASGAATGIPQISMQPVAMKGMSPRLWNTNSEALGSPSLLNRP